MRKLILGASGFLGRYFQESENGINVSHSRENNSGKYDIYKTIENAKDVKDILLETKPNVVINNIALADIEECQNNKETASWLNVELPGLLAKECQPKHIKLIHISTDAVFDGTKPLKTELDSPNPKSFYGESKLLGERKVIENNVNALVARVNFFGYSHAKQSIFNFFYYAGKYDLKVKGYSDVYFTPLYAGHLVKVINSALNLDLKGIYNVVGNERISKFEFGRRILKAFSYNAELVTPTMLSENQNASRFRSLDLSLDNSKIKLAGVKVPSLENGIKSLKNEVRQLNEN